MRLFLITREVSMNYKKQSETLSPAGEAFYYELPP